MTAVIGSFPRGKETRKILYMGHPVRGMGLVLPSHAGGAERRAKYAGACVPRRSVADRLSRQWYRSFVFPAVGGTSRLSVFVRESDWRPVRRVETTAEGTTSVDAVHRYLKNGVTLLMSNEHPRPSGLMSRGI